jgi:hypothetical protein
MRSCIAAALLLAACAGSTPPCLRLPEGRWCAAALPMVPPFLEQQQSLVLEKDGQRQQWLASVQWTPDALHQTVLSPLGQVLFELHYENGRLQFAQAAPITLAPVPALLDLQLMIWPAELLRPQLPAGLTLQQDPASDGRQLWRAETLLAEVQVRADGTRTLIHHERGYRLEVRPLSTLAGPDGVAE